MSEQIRNQARTHQLETRHKEQNTRWMWYTAKEKAVNEPFFKDLNHTELYI